MEIKLELEQLKAISNYYEFPIAVFFLPLGEHRKMSKTTRTDELRKENELYAEAYAQSRIPDTAAPPSPEGSQIAEGELPEHICECGLEKEPESCHACHGEGGYHDCGEDTCCCLDKSPNIICDECDGTGEYLVCPNAEAHYKEQRATEQSDRKGEAVGEASEGRAKAGTSNKEV